MNIDARHCLCEIIKVYKITFKYESRNEYET